MKALVVLALVAAARAGLVLQSVSESGVSTQHRTQDVWGNYNFAYDEKHTSGGSWRKESGDAAGNTVGSYGLTDADGRIRIVNYVADAHGFRASIATNEPGTAASSPAGVGINAPPGPTGPDLAEGGNFAEAGLAFAATAPVAVAAAPVLAPAAVAAPVAVAAPSAVAISAPAPAVAFSAPVAKVSLAAAAPAVGAAPVATIAASPAVTYAGAFPAFAAAPAATAVKFAAAFPAVPQAFAGNVFGTAISGIVGYSYGRHK
ncbi:uncharacterized protein LOC144099196 [Amblyomma americanum]